MRALIIIVCLALAGPALAQPQEQDIMRNRTGGTVPVPDPTTLTIELLNREVATIKEQIELTDRSLRELIDVRFTAVDSLLDLQVRRVTDLTEKRDVELDKLRETLDSTLIDLKELIFERFNRVEVSFANVENQFVSRDTALSAALSATETAASNALTATEKAVATAGTVTSEKIDQQARLFAETTGAIRNLLEASTTRLSALEAKTATAAEVNAVAQRLTAIEARTAGLGEAKSAFGDNIGMFVGLGGLALALVIFVLGRKEPPRPIYVNGPQPSTTTTTATHA